MNSKPRISIITVVYNGKEAIQQTIKSIAAQTYTNIEYIVVDGASTDGTVDIIKNSSSINQWVSEKDKGLYDAMNKGIDMATGDYLWFINAGDSIFDNTILDKVFSLPLADVYYGQTMIVDAQGKELGLRRLKAPENFTWKSLLNGMLVCHQSFIVRKEITTKYSTHFHISADYEWMIKCMKKAKTVCNSHLTLSRFLDGGLNKTRMGTGLKERYSIMMDHYGFFPTLFVHLYFPIRFAIFYLIHKRV